MPDKIMTRAEFWEKHAEAMKHADFKDRGFALHREYWGAYVRAFNIHPPLHLADAAKTARDAGDEHMNAVSLRQWEVLHWPSYTGLTKALRDNGDVVSIGNAVCLTKEAMRIHLDAR